MDTQEVKEPQTSSEKIKEPQTSSEKEEPEQITTTTKQTVPKNPGRIAAGKKLAEHNKKAREAKKKSSSNTQTVTSKKENPPSSQDEQREQSSSFSLTQVLSVASIAVSLAGLYYKREELKHLFKNKSKIERSEKAQKQLIDHMVEVERKNIETKKSPKLKQMD